MKKTFRVTLICAFLLAIVLCLGACQISDIPEELIGMIPNEIKNLHEHPWDEWSMIYIESEVSLVCNVCQATVKTQPFSEGLDIRDGVLYGMGDCTDKEIVVPYGVTSIVKDAFQGEDITGVLLPNTVKSIEDDAFKGCQSLAVFHFPMGLETIGENAFQNCKALVAIVLPSSIKSLGAYSFQNCHLLGAIYYYGVEDDWNKVEKGKDWNKGAGKHAVTYKGVVVGPNDTHTHEYLTIVTDPTCIEQGVVLYECQGCDHTYSEYTSPLGHSFGEWITTKEPNATETGTKERVCSACGEVESEEIPVIIHEAIEGTLGLMFRLNEDGESYSIVGVGTFKETELVIPSVFNEKPVTSIGVAAFCHCDWITSIVIPDSIVEIGNTAFADCFVLVEIYLPQTIKTFNDNLFGSCTKLKEINFNGTMERWYSIEKKATWNSLMGNSHGYVNINCIDGTISEPHVHKWSKWVATTKPTCSTDGVVTCYCRCGYESTETWPAVPHHIVYGVCTTCGSFADGESSHILSTSWIMEMVPPTLDSAGYTIFYCSEYGCEYSYTSNEYSIMTEGTYVLNANDLDFLAPYTNHEGQITVYNDVFAAHYFYNSKIDHSTKFFDDGFIGNRRINLQGPTRITYTNGQISKIKGCIQITTAGDTTINVWYVLGKVGTYLAIYDQHGNIIDTSAEATEQNQVGMYQSITLPAGTYYIGSVEGGIYIQKIEVEVKN